MLKFPVTIDNIEDFERINKISVNVFNLDKNNKINVLYLHKIINKKIINLMLIHKDKKFHYIFVKSLNALFSKDGKNVNHCCELCLQIFSRLEGYNKHIKNGVCKTIINEAVIEMPTEGKNLLKFKNVKNTVFAPFSGYYDMESMLIPINDKDKKTETYQQHKVTHIGFTLVSRYPDLLKNNYITFEGELCIINFLNHLIELQDKILNIVKYTNIEMSLNKEEQEQYLNAKFCHLCFNNLNDKINDKGVANLLK